MAAENAAVRAWLGSSAAEYATAGRETFFPNSPSVTKPNAGELTLAIGCGGTCMGLRTRAAMAARSFDGALTEAAEPLRAMSALLLRAHGLPGSIAEAEAAWEALRKHNGNVAAAEGYAAQLKALGQPVDAGYLLAVRNDLLVLSPSSAYSRLLTPFWCPSPLLFYSLRQVRGNYSRDEARRLGTTAAANLTRALARARLAVAELVGGAAPALRAAVAAQREQAAPGEGAAALLATVAALLAMALGAAMVRRSLATDDKCFLVLLLPSYSRLLP